MNKERKYIKERKPAFARVYVCARMHVYMCACVLACVCVQAGTKKAGLFFGLACYDGYLLAAMRANDCGLFFLRACWLQ